MLSAAARPWSSAQRGLRARVRVQAEDVGGAWRHAVWLELGNVASKPLALLLPPALDASLSDASGQAARPAPTPPGNGPQPAARQ